MQLSNQEVFFELLRAGFWEKSVRLSAFDKIDFDEVYRIAEYQSVVGLIAAGLEHADVKPPQDIVLTFVGSTLQLEQRNKAMNAFIAHLLKELRSVGAYALLVKGQGIAQCYERPLWRACGDVDLFLSEDNYEKARQFLIPLASFVEQEETYKKHIGLTIDNWLVELHGNLYSSLSYRVERELDAIYSDSFYKANVSSLEIGGTYVFKLGNENNIIYVFTHILQHYFHGGIGLRQICDWCRLLWTVKGEINVSSLKERLCKMGLLSEWRAFAYFAVSELGMEETAMLLYEENSRWKHLSDKIKAYLMTSGNFGHRDLSYVKELSYVSRKIRSMKSVVSETILHIGTFPADSVRFFLYYLWIRTFALLRGE